MFDNHNTVSIVAAYGIGDTCMTVDLLQLMFFFMNLHPVVCDVPIGKTHTLHLERSLWFCTKRSADCCRFEPAGLLWNDWPHQMSAGSLSWIQIPKWWRESFLCLTLQRTCFSDCTSDTNSLLSEVTSVTMAVVTHSRHNGIVSRHLVNSA